ncbi:hypothetical protein, partial [Pseudoxanthomonas sp. KAs_5_3]|uniref:hypothetical protein n=1 Tax=Pseudoxanthomonas sp. KAs_5_3 TaxID=2067658 RepID=UPI001E338F58
SPPRFSAMILFDFTAKYPELTTLVASRYQPSAAVLIVVPFTKGKVPVMIGHSGVAMAGGLKANNSRIRDIIGLYPLVSRVFCI